MAFTGTALRTAKLDLTLLGCESLITCSPLVRLGDKGQTIISARISNGDPTLDLTGWEMGFEATVGDKLIRDENQSRFRLVGKNIVEYKCSDEVHSFIGTVNVAYFTLKKDGTTATTQNFTIHSLQNAETGTDGLKEHYVSVIDDLVKSNGEAMGKAEEIKDLIDKNQVVRKSGDSMSGNLEFDRTKGVLFKNGDGISVMFLTADNLNRFVGFSTASNENVFVYDPATKFFDLRTGSNLLKKTGDTMTGNLMFDVTGGNKLVGFRRADGKQSYLYGGEDTIGVYSTINDKTPWRYVASTDTFDVNAGNTNLLKKSEIYSNFVQPSGRVNLIDGTDLDSLLTPGMYAGKQLANAPGGDTVSYFYVDVVLHANSGFARQEATTLTQGTQRKWFRTMGSNVWRPWVETTSNSRDGRVDLILTAVATNANSGYLPYATRRGNTVTVRMEITRNAGSTGTTVCTLPVDMRPTETLSHTILANDGSPVGVNISWNGNVDVFTTGKQFKFVSTYVVN